MKHLNANIEISYRKINWIYNYNNANENNFWQLKLLSPLNKFIDVHAPNSC